MPLHPCCYGFLIKILLDFINGLCLCYTALCSRLSKPRIRKEKPLLKSNIVKNSDTLMECLGKIPDHRDNRGKRHELSFVLACVLTAVLSRRTYLSSIHRFMTNKIEWLKDMFDRPGAAVVSRAQLPNILSGVDWDSLNDVCETVLAAHIECSEHTWKAIDGKSLKGTIVDASRAHEHERIVSVVEHGSRDILYQQRFSGEKESEVAVARELLQTTGLLTAKISLDAGHVFPDTLAPIHHNGGMYVVQVKGNQPRLLESLVQLAEQTDGRERSDAEQPSCEPASPNTAPAHESPSCGVVLTSTDKAHGRLEERVGRVMELPSGRIDARWDETGIQTLIVMDRTTTTCTTGHTSRERSYYVSNQSAAAHERELFTAIREHWSIESVHWIRDVTFNEDNVRTSNRNAGQVLALLRTSALHILQTLRPRNINAQLEEFADTPSTLRNLLAQLGLVPAQSRGS